MINKLTDLPAYPSQFPSVGARWRESAKRYAMLSGAWYQHLREEFVRWFPNEQTQMQIGRVDITKNTAQAVISQLSTLYDVAPIVQHADAEAAREMAALCDDAGLWQLQRAHQQFVIAQREGAVRAFCGHDGKLRLGQVPAHLLHAIALPQDPDVPVAIYEYRVRAVRIDETKSDMIWTREVWDVSDPSQPIWRIEDEQGTDITRLVIGESGTQRR